MSGPRRKLAVALLLGAGSMALSGCFTSAADFGDDAETYIVESEELRDALFAERETTFVEATCVDPRNQDVGTTFACDAVDSDDATWEFEIVITARTEYEVNVSRFPAAN